ncbi:hypothetical protein H0A66_02795 [Alcaligenaceae bacterium]|nr:hypothetical protein [Alcaligenaceae bacterium]
MGDNHFASLPSAAYGFVLLMAAIAFYILQRCIIAADGKFSLLKRAIGSDWKGKLSPALYFVAICASFAAHWLAQLIYVTVAIMWVVPDKRIERTIDPIDE